MDTKKVVILILVVVGVLTYLALGAGIYRHQTDSKTAGSDSSSAMVAIGSVTDAFLADFEVSRLEGCPRAGSTITVNGDCTIEVAAGGARPSRFELVPKSGLVRLCYGLSTDQLTDCRNGDSDMEAQTLDEAAKFTVADQPAFLWLACSGGGSTTCAVEVR